MHAIYIHTNTVEKNEIVKCILQESSLRGDVDTNSAGTSGDHQLPN